MPKRNLMQHWIAIAMAAAVVLIFLLALVVFQVSETEMVMVMRLGKPRTEAGPAGAPRVKIYPPGAHFKWPLVEALWRHDNRLQCYELQKGQTEQVQTADEYQAIVTTFVLWRIGDPAVFQRAVSTTAAAENILDNKVRDARNNILGRHRLGDLINTDPKRVKIPEVEAEILGFMKDACLRDFGIAIEMVGFKHLGFPEEVNNKVFDRMRAERQRKSGDFRAEGTRDALKIKARAEQGVKEMLDKAEAEATKIRAEGDSIAARSYEVFARNPRLAVFLRKLEALRQGVDAKTTLILDTQTPPYDLLRPGATLLPAAGPLRNPDAAAQGK
ncbi:MAG: protease modulator HflC [Lentisphaeria bacterium]|jgi:membrane protease subunit HflC